MSNKRLVVATKNKGKLKEIREILSGFEIIGTDELNVVCDTVEDGVSFLENAHKKAYELMQLTGGPVLADDSGLEVDALGGQPGVFSARFAGEHATDGENTAKLLHELENVPQEKRGARFVCVMCLVYPDGTKIASRGECSGSILPEARGENGFGYDPVFYVEQYGKTFAELSPEEKNAISHRRLALEELKEYLGLA